MDAYEGMSGPKATFMYLSGKTFESMEVVEDILVSIYLSIGIVGLLINLIVIITILRSRSLNFFPYHMLLINLFGSNILMAVFCVPFTLINLLRRTWTHGQFMCKLIPALQGIGFGVSSTTVTIAAVDRYMEVKSRKQFVGVYYSKRFRVIVESIIIWTCAIIFAMPVAYFQRLVSTPVEYSLNDDGQSCSNTTTFYHCIQDWPPLVGLLYSIFMLLFGAIIPVTVLSVTSMFITRQSIEIPDHERRRNALYDRSVLRTLLIMTISFTICMLPLYTVHVLIDTGIILQEKLPTTNVYLLFAIVHAIAMISIPLNAIVYGWLTPSIKRGLIPSICVSVRVPSGIIELSDIEGEN